MNDRQSNPRAAALAGALVLLAIIAWQAVAVRTLYEGNWSGLFFSASRFGVPEALKDSTYFHKDSDGYDGQFYRLVAHDPWRSRGFGSHIDSPNLRYSRGLLPVAAYLLAGGRDEWIDTAYIALTDILMAAGVYWSASLFLLWGRSLWWSLLTVLLPATLASIHRMVLDGPFTALVAGFLFAWERGHKLLCAVLAGLAMGMRETGALLVVALVMDAIVRRRWREAARAASMAIPAALWIAVNYRGAKVAVQGIGIIGWPVIGHIHRLFEPWPVGATWRLTTAEAAQRLALIGLLVAVVFAARYLRNHQWRAPEWVMAGYCLLTLGLASYPYLRESLGFARPVTPLLMILAWTGIRDAAPARVAVCLVPSVPILMTFASDALRMTAALFRA